MRYRGDYLEYREDGSWAKYSVEEFFFDAIDTDAKAHILYYTATDAHIANAAVKYRCVASDVDILSKIKIATKSTSPIEPYSMPGGHLIEGREMPAGEYVRLTICSRRWCDNLRRYGLSHNKSLHLTPPGPIPEHLEPSAWRGAVDGDGWITKFLKDDGIHWQIGLCSASYEFLDAFRQCVDKWRKKLGWHFRVKGLPTIKGNNNKGNPTYMVKYGDRTAAIVARWLYKDAPIYLDRKKVLADELMTFYSLPEYERKRLAEEMRANSVTTPVKPRKVDLPDFEPITVSSMQTSLPH